MRRCLLALVFLLMIPAMAAADEVQLKSGDRYTGTIVRLSGGTLTFKTPHGELNIPWADITALTVTMPLQVAVGKQPPVMVTSIAAGTAAGRVTLTPGGDVALADITGIAQIE